MSQPDNDRRGALARLFDRFSLSWRLMADGRVSLFHKLIPPLTLLYLISPIDFAPELVLGPLGVVDDIGVAILALEFFIRMAPSDVVREHLEHLQNRFSQTTKRKNDENIVEGNYTHRD